MAVDFDQFPIYDPIIRADTDRLSDVWSNAFSTFIQTLIGYLSQNGMFIPRLTTAQINQIQNPIDGQIVYNTTLGRFQGREAGFWRTFTLI